MRRIQRDKIRQTAGADNAWPRIDDHDSLFIFTDWARSPLPDRIARITDAIRDVPNTAADGITLDHDHVSGVGPDPPRSQGLAVTKSHCAPPALALTIT